MRKPEYIAQESGGNCGAAALAMVLGQFDFYEPPQKIAKLLTKIGPNGQPSIKTHELANYARSLGFSTMIAQFSEPWKALINCHEAGLGLIINHRLDKEKPTGHFSVLADIRPTDDKLSLHDPQRGPNQRRTRAELLELWSPLVPGSQIAGQVGVIIGPRPVGGVAGVCSACSLDFDDQTPLKCSRCSIVLEPLPGFPVGCLAETCPRRLWRRIFCPNCDTAWSGHALPRKNPRANIHKGLPTLPNSNPSDQMSLETKKAQAQAITQADEPEEDLSAQKLAEALKSIPVPDWGIIAALALSQKQTLLELSEFSNVSDDLRERAMEWDIAADEVRQQASQLEANRNNLAAEIQANADALKTGPEEAQKLTRLAPDLAEPPQDEPPAEARPELPTGAELVARLMAMAKKKG